MKTSRLLHLPQLWRTASEFTRCLTEWMDGPFTEIDADFMSNEVDRWWRGTAKLAKTLEGGPLEVGPGCLVG